MNETKQASESASVYVNIAIMKWTPNTHNMSCSIIQLFRSPAVLLVVLLFLFLLLSLFSSFYSFYISTFIVLGLILFLSHFCLVLQAHTTHSGNHAMHVYENTIEIDWKMLWLWQAYTHFTSSVHYGTI